MIKNETKLILILLLLSALLFFFKLGSFSLYDAAETTYGEFIKEIRLTGDWITMHYNGEIIFDKPPLYFWLATLATYIFGFNEFAIRFWAALSGVLTVLVTFYLGKSFYNQRIGFLSAIIAMTSFQFLIQSRIAELDILLTLLITLSFLFFWQGYQTKKAYSFWLFYGSLALATLTKGIIGIALPAAAIFLFLLIRKELKRLREMQILPGIILIFLIAAPWYFAEWYLHGGKFTQFVLGFLFLSRFQGVVSGHPGPWYYYFLALILGFAPWSHFLPYSFIRSWRNRISSPELLSLCFIIPTFMVFSIAKTKLPNYVLPLYPFLAIMVGKWWDDTLEKPATKRRGFLISNLLLLVVVFLIIIGFVLLGTANYSGQYQDLLPNLQLLAIILASGALCSVLCALCSKYKYSFYALPVTVFLITLILTTQTLPAIEKYKGAKELGKKVGQALQPGKIIAAYKVGNRPSIVFYNSKPIVFLENEKQLVNFLRGKKGYCFTALHELEKNKIKTRIFAKKGDLAVLY